MLTLEPKTFRGAQLQSERNQIQDGGDDTWQRRTS